jgi:hypothetical protein
MIRIDSRRRASALDAERTVSRTCFLTCQALSRRSNISQAIEQVLLFYSLCL